MKSTETVKIFLLGMIAATLIISTLQPQSPGFALADGSTATKSGLMALVGPKDATLFLIDSRKETIAHYQTQGTTLALRTGRYFGYDTQLYDHIRGHLDVNGARKESGSKENKKNFLRNSSSDD